MSESQLSGIKVKLEADASGVKRGTDSAKKELSSLGTSAGGVSSSFKGVGTSATDLSPKLSSVGSVSGSATKALGAVAAASAAAAAAFLAVGKATASYIKDGAKMVDELAKTSKALDSTIGGLQTLRLAAQLGGVSVSDLDTSMEKFNQRLGEASNGSGRAAQALKVLNLSARDLIGMDLDSKFATVSDRIKQMNMSSEAAASTLRDLGIRSKEMTGFMRGGGDAIRETRGDLEEMGVILSNAQARQVESFNDSMTRAGVVVDGFKQKLAVYSAPYLDALVQKMTEVVTETERVDPALITTIETIVKLGNAATTVADAFFEMGKALKEFRDEAVKGLPDYDDVGEFLSGDKSFFDIVTEISEKHPMPRLIRRVTGNESFARPSTGGKSFNPYGVPPVTPGPYGGSWDAHLAAVDEAMILDFPSPTKKALDSAETFAMGGVGGTPHSGGLAERGTRLAEVTTEYAPYILGSAAMGFGALKGGAAIHKAFSPLGPVSKVGGLLGSKTGASFAATAGPMVAKHPKALMAGAYTAGVAGGAAQGGATYFAGRSAFDEGKKALSLAPENIFEAGAGVKERHEERSSFLDSIRDTNKEIMESVNSDTEKLQQEAAKRQEEFDNKRIESERKREEELFKINKKSYDLRLTRLSESLMDEQELVEKRFDDNQKILQDGLSSKFLTEEHYLEMTEKLREDYQKRLDAIMEKEGAEEAARNEKLLARLELIQESFKTEEELIREKLENEQELLKESLDKKLIDEEYYNEMRVKINKDAQDKIDDIRKKERQSSQAALKGFTSDLASMTATTAAENKKMFELNKIASLANAMLDAHEAISGAYKVGARIGGPILGSAFAAAAGFAQFARIKQISSTSFGGGASAAPSASPASTPSIPSDVGGVTGDRAGGLATIQIVGSENAVFSTEQVRGLIEQINDQVDKGMRIKVV